jgi:putative ABC transport system permease protein
MRDIHNSRWLKLLAFLCPDHLYEEIEGDLIQKFRRDVILYPARKAKRRFVWNVLRFLRPGIFIRKTFSFGLNEGFMIKSYLRIMLRNALKRKLYAAINILGLSTGIAFALLIGVFTWTEMQVNKSLGDVDRLYLLEAKSTTEGQGNPFFTPAPLVPRVNDQYPDRIDGLYRFLERNITFSSGDKHLRLQGMIGDSSLVPMFGFRVVSGDGVRALSKPSAIVITEKVAKQFFNRNDVVGETLVLATEGSGASNYEITAVIGDLEKKNSVTDFMNMDAQVFLSIHQSTDFSFSRADLNDWNNSLITYVKLAKGVSASEVSGLLNKTQKKDSPPAIGGKQQVEMKPLMDYYRMTNHGAVQSLLVSLMIIVAFILLLAVANFINITISGSFSRLKEIGVRKVIGGIRQQVVTQFVAESIIFAVISGAIGLVLYELLHGYFGVMLDGILPSVIQFPIAFWIAIPLAIIFVGILAGIYPAFYLSTTRTIESLKGKFKSVSGTINFSRGLIGLQFMISIFILIGSMIMSQQISYFLDKDLGYDKNAILVVTSAPRRWTPEGFLRIDAAKREFLASPAVSSMSLSTGSPTGNFNMSGDVVYSAGHSVQEGVSAELTGTDEDFATVYGMKMVEGSYFNLKGEAPVPFAVVINESAQKALSVQLGDKIKFRGSGEKEFPVVGIIHDFHFLDLHQAIGPVVIMHSRDFLTFRYFSIKLATGDLTTGVNEVEAIWRKAFPDDAFVFEFADQRIQRQYKTELQLKKASAVASVLMLVIVMTGVLGLVALSVAKRNKEIGIRKVLGASASTILVLLSREYTLVMLGSFAIAGPLSYWFVSSWLNTFVYHIDLSWWMFAVPMVFVFSITVLIVSAQGIGAALSNPVKSLKYE